MLIDILIQIVIPVFVLIGIGALVNRFIVVDLPMLNKLVFHVFAPAIVFLKLVNTDLDLSSLGIVAAFCFLHLLILLLISWNVFGRGPFRAHRPVIAMGSIFYNAGNYGFPFAQLAFGDYGVSVMAIILAVQVLTNFTIGIWMMDAENGSWRSIIKSFARIPLIYAILLAMLLNALHLQPPDAVVIPLNYLGNGLIPTALLSLGIQLARSKIVGNLGSLSTLVFTRLVLSPLLAVGLAAVWALVAPAQFAVSAEKLLPVLVIGLGMPVAINVYILCAEYNQDPELASQSIFWTTLLSAFTLTGWLAVMRL